MRQPPHVGCKLSRIMEGVFKRYMTQTIGIVLLVKEPMIKEDFDVQAASVRAYAVGVPVK